MKPVALALVLLTAVTAPGLAEARPRAIVDIGANLGVALSLGFGPGGRGGPDHGGGQRDFGGRPAISIDGAIERSRARVPRNARLLDASAENQGGRVVYRVRWSVDGRRIDVMVDGNSGAILGVED